MKIDLGTAIIGFISIAICLIPFLAMSFKRKKKEKMILDALNQNTINQIFTIQKKEICNNFAIGLDLQKKYVFFIKFNKDNTLNLHVDLTQVKQIEVDKKTRAYTSDMQTNHIIEQINLIFSMKTGEKIQFPLYEDKTDLQLNGEIQLAYRWIQELNQIIEAKNI
jgi:hypothetical protein